MKQLNLLLHYLLLVVQTCCVWNLALSQAPVTDSQLQHVAKSLAKFVDPLPDTTTVLGYTPLPARAPAPGYLTIGMYQITWKFHRDLPATNVFAYGTSPATASVPGPMIEAVHGVPTYVKWENHLPSNHILPWDRSISVAIPKSGGVPTVVHLHGGIQSPASDGHALAWFTNDFKETGPNFRHTTYMYPNVQHSTNLWYHDHAVGLTRVNLLAGLIAPYVIRDPELDSRLNLPSGPTFDRHLMVFDRSFTSDGALFINRTGNIPDLHPQWQPEYYGHVIVVNGKAWPHLRVQRRKYRFRITNVSNARYFNLKLTNGLSFTVVGSDGSYLPSPVTSSAVILSPAETVDAVIDFTLCSGTESILTNDAPYPFPTGTPVDDLNSQVMKFLVDQAPLVTADTSTVPPILHISESATLATGKALVTRYIGLYERLNNNGDSMELVINGKRFADPVTETPRTGSTEIWEVINLTGDNHPLHIHLAEFQAIKAQSLNDPTGAFRSCMTGANDAVSCNISSYATGALDQIPAYEKTWKNIVKISPGYVTTVVVKFNLVDGDEKYPFDATAEPGYVYHCHILDHEDNEMIRPFKLVP